MRSKKTELCCIVNSEGKCRRCKKRTCKVHSFTCIECEVVCNECSQPKRCEHCTTQICHWCVMVTHTGAAVCPYCYDENTRQWDLEYGEDEYDR